MAQIQARLRPHLMLTGGMLSAFATGCTEVLPHPVQAELTPNEVTIETANRTQPPQFATFQVENTGASTVFISAAIPQGEMAHLLVIDLPPFTPVQPEQIRPLRVSIDDRIWQWKTGEYQAKFPLEISYFFSGQEVHEPEPISSAQPERQAELFPLTVNFSLNCDIDMDGYDSVECGGSDCNDNDRTIHIDAEEFCDGKDNDCDGAVDDLASDRRAYWLDADSDRYGDPATETLACEEPGLNWVQQGGDCDDDQVLANPNQRESCFDNIDNDCDDDVDEHDSDCN